MRLSTTTFIHFNLSSTHRSRQQLVILPMALGQLIRQLPIIEKIEKYKKFSSNFSQLVLLGVAFQIFSDTFGSAAGYTHQSSPFNNPYSTIVNTHNHNRSYPTQPNPIQYNTNQYSTKQHKTESNPTQFKLV